MREDVRKFLSFFIVGILLLGSIPAYANFTEGNIILNREAIGSEGITTFSDEEFDLKIKVTIAKGPNSQVYLNGKLYDKEISVKVKSGDKINLKAVAGKNEQFIEWTGQYKSGMSNKKVNENFNSQKDLETTFTVTDDLKGKTLTIISTFAAVKHINISVEPSDIGGLEASSDQSRVIVGGEIILSANSTNDDYQFSFWEFDKTLIHPEFINKDADINNPNIQFKVDPFVEKYNEFNIIAHFEKKSDPKVKIKKNIIENVEILLAQDYKLPEKIESEMDDGNKLDLLIVWINDSVNINKLGDQKFYGIILGYGGNPYVTLNLKVKPRDQSNFQIELDVDSNERIKDPTLIVGGMSGEELKRTLILENGSNLTTTIKAIDGQKTRFRKWEASGLRNTEKVEFNNLLLDPSSSTTTFKIDSSLFGLDKNKVDIRAIFDILNDIKITTNYPDISALSASHAKAVKGDKVSLTAKSTNEDYEFLNWEFEPNIIGAGTPNTDIDLKATEIVFEMIEIPGLKLEIAANFEEKKDLTIKTIQELNEKTYVGEEYKLPKEVEAIMNDGSKRMVKVTKWNPENADTSKAGPRSFFGSVDGYSGLVSLKLTVKEKEPENIISLEDIEAQVGLGTEYQLPKTVTAKMSNNTYKELAVTWTPSTVDTNDLGDQVFEGTVEGFYEKVILTLTIKAKEPIEEILEIKTVELLKDGELVGNGVINGEQIVITLPGNMSQEEIDVIGRSGYILKITATEGVTIEQEGGYKGPFWQEGTAVNMVDANTPTKFILHGEYGIKEYTLTIVAKAQEKEKHTINFNTNGGNNISSQIVEEGNKATKPSNPNRTGYKFINWYTDSSLSNIFNFNTVIAENITLYAKWEVVTSPVVGQYKVAFNTNGGNSISSQIVEEGSRATKPSNPTRTVYSFVNWYTDSSLTNIFSFNTPITKDITLYAKWDRVAEESNSARITKFSLLGYEGSIDDRNGYITVYIPYNMELNGLVPNITLSEGATISPRGDVAVNFNRSVYYTVYAKDGSKKEYRVSINMPREDSSRENYWDDYYDNYKRKRDDYYKKRSEVSWWEMSQEAKKERDKEALKDNRDELLIYKERNKIMNEIGKIESRFKNGRSSLSIIEGYNKIEIKPTVSNFAEGHSNMIIIPKGILSSLPKGEYDYLTYATGVVNIDIYPFMETITGLRLNLKDVSNDIRQKWNKVKGRGFIFEVESDSTKGGLSYELNLEKKYPIEKIRFVQYDYTKGNFKDVSPEKWYIFDGKIRCENVSAGIYGIIYKD